MKHTFSEGRTAAKIIISYQKKTPTEQNTCDCCAPRIRIPTAFISRQTGEEPWLCPSEQWWGAGDQPGGSSSGGDPHQSILAQFLPSRSSLVPSSHLPVWLGPGRCVPVLWVGVSHGTGHSVRTLQANKAR